MTAILGLVDEAVLFGLVSFCAQLLLTLLRGGSSVRVRLVPERIPEPGDELRDPQRRVRDCEERASDVLPG